MPEIKPNSLNKYLEKIQETENAEMQKQCDQILKSLLYSKEWITYRTECELVKPQHSMIQLPNKTPYYIVIQMEDEHILACYGYSSSKKINEYPLPNSKFTIFHTTVYTQEHTLYSPLYNIIRKTCADNIKERKQEAKKHLGNMMEYVKQMNKN